MTGPGTRRLWIRVDASERIGLGHLMRSVAVAQAAKRQRIAVTFVLHAGPYLCTIPEKLGFHVRRLNAADEMSWLEGVKPQDFVLFDGYTFVSTDHEAARARRALVAQVDDCRTGHFSVDVFINPADEDKDRYELPSSTSILLGSAFTLVRDEFLLYRRQRQGGTSTLLVTLGGSDATGVTETVLSVLVRGPFERLLVVMGPGARALDRRKWPIPVEVLRDPSDLAATFDWADAAVSAAGTTTWELMAMGIPSALIQVADNQRNVVRTALSAGAALFAGELPVPADRLLRAVVELADTGTQRILSQAALELIDGRGADRVVASLIDRSLKQPAKGQ